ncbi:MAG TPA: acyltransferase family protein [Allosphingosinicella sp.]|uniref:acyltransferase family protein n=1 Tax=Allosphingosinicella sp. TaxID=2823234 RepID=UPI002EDB5EAA
MSSGAAFSSHYRAEIDGIRAIAVVPVILYHAGLGPFTGGYVGVDIFFVISGYLITSIILGDLAKGRLTFGDFYERRIRRIFPALFLVTAVTSLLAWFVLLPQEMRDFGQSVVATMLFVANIFFYLKSGYFAPDVDTFPLIHMWSLAVEEQFYIVFPVILLLIVGSGRTKWLRPVLLLAIASSFLASIWMQERNPSANFFLPLFRAWELGLGALLAATGGVIRPFFERKRALASIAEIAGLAIILAAIVLMDRSTPFPGWFALPPVIGTALIIAASSGTTPVGRLLSLPLFVGIGLISYSAYLWHQPLFALARSLNGFPLHRGFYVALIAVTFLLAFLSWKYVEQPFRNRAFIGRKTLFGLSALLALLLVAFGLLAHVTRGFPDRFGAERIAIAETMTLSPKRDACHTDGTDYRPPSAACAYGGAQTSWAILGDSHGIEIGYALAERLAKQGQGLLHLTFSACPAALSFDPANPGCGAWTEEAVRRLEGDSRIRSVVIAYRHGLYLYGDQREHYPSAAQLPPAFMTDRSPEAARSIYWRDFDRLVSRLRKAGKRVHVLGPVPELPVTAEWFVFRQGEKAHLSASFYTGRQGAILDRLRGMERAGHIRLIEPGPALCDRQNCRVVIGGQSMYFDDNHLSMPGARRVLAREAAEGPLE